MPDLSSQPQQPEPKKPRGQKTDYNQNYQQNNNDNGNKSDNSTWGCCCLLIVLIFIIALVYVALY